MEKYIVEVETNDGDITLDITADNLLDMYNQANNIDQFVRIKDYTEDVGD